MSTIQTLEDSKSKLDLKIGLSLDKMKANMLKLENDISQKNKQIEDLSQQMLQEQVMYEDRLSQLSSRFEMENYQSDRSSGSKPVLRDGTDNKSSLAEGANLNSDRAAELSERPKDEMAKLVSEVAAQREKSDALALELEKAAAENTELQEQN